MTYLFDLFGVAVFAATGCLAGGRKNMDLVGVLVVGLVTALGGGTMRDLVLDVPVFWVTENVYLFAGIAGVLVTFVGVRFRPAPAGLLLVLDAFGLALFAVLGAQKALALETSGFIAVMMGAMTGVAGGVIRDILCNEIPTIFVETELYATPAIIGATAFVVLTRFGAPETVPLMAGFVMTLVIRLSALRWHITLPIFRGPDETPRS